MNLLLVDVDENTNISPILVLLFVLHTCSEGGYHKILSAVHVTR